MTTRTVLPPGDFDAGVARTDPLIAQAIEREMARTQGVIELIASENIVSRAVLDVQGSILTNKTVEGYPGKRYHAGAVNVDVIESAAIDPQDNAAAEAVCPARVHALAARLPTYSA